MPPKPSKKGKSSKKKPKSAESKGDDTIHQYQVPSPFPVFDPSETNVRELYQQHGCHSLEENRISQLLGLSEGEIMTIDPQTYMSEAAPCLTRRALPSVRSRSVGYFDTRPFTSAPTIMKSGGAAPVHEITRSFTSAITFIEHLSHLWEQGSDTGIFNRYLWEGIETVDAEDGIFGVILFHCGEWRAVFINSRVMVHRERSLFPLTDRGEIWPALLFKALLVIAGRDPGRILNTFWCFHKLSGGMVPEDPIPLNDLATAKQHLSGIDEDKDRVMVLVPDPDRCKSMGVDPSGAALVDRFRYYGSDALVRVIFAAGRWKWCGEYRYEDAELWTADFEEEIGWERQNRYALPSNLADEWISWNSEAVYFKMMQPFLLANGQEHRYSYHVPGEGLNENEDSHALYIPSLPNLHRLGFHFDSYDCAAESPVPAKDDTPQLEIWEYRWETCLDEKAFLYSLPLSHLAFQSVDVPAQQHRVLLIHGKGISTECFLRITASQELRFAPLSEIKASVLGIHTQELESDLPQTWSERGGRVLSQYSFAAAEDMKVTVRHAFEESKEEDEKNKTKKKKNTPKDPELKILDFRESLDLLKSNSRSVMVDNGDGSRQWKTAHLKDTYNLPACPWGYTWLLCVDVDEAVEISPFRSRVTVLSDRSMPSWTPVSTAMERHYSGSYTINSERSLYNFALQTPERTSFSWFIRMKARIPSRSSTKVHVRFGNEENDLLKESLDIPCDGSTISVERHLDSSTLSGENKGKQKQGINIWGVARLGADDADAIHQWHKEVVQNAINQSKTTEHMSTETFQQIFENELSSHPCRIEYFVSFFGSSDKIKLEEHHPRDKKLNAMQLDRNRIGGKEIREHYFEERWQEKNPCLVGDQTEEQPDPDETTRRLIRPKTPRNTPRNYSHDSGNREDASEMLREMLSTEKEQQESLELEMDEESKQQRDQLISQVNDAYEGIRTRRHEKQQQWLDHAEEISATAKQKKSSKKKGNKKK